MHTSTAPILLDDGVVDEGSCLSPTAAPIAVPETQQSSYGKIKEYCLKKGGKRVIQRVLIANNGIAALKEIRSIRKWSYEVFQDDRVIQFVVMATPDDINANAEYIRLADEYVLVPGGPNNLNYANVPLIVDIAIKAKVQAVWAGWGHASENPRLPESLKENGLIFIGPTAGAMRSLGDKIASMIVAQTAQVPCLPWSGSGLTMQTKIDSNGIPAVVADDVVTDCSPIKQQQPPPPPLQQISTIPEQIFQAACVSSPEEGLQMAKKVGFPLMIKASEGGGGKGIRAVQDESTFLSSLDSAQREVPGSPVFLMALSKRARHLEVQLLADEYGQAIALNGRDCSMQRRHQKVIEEAPISCLGDPERWKEMERCAVRLAKMVSYTNAGTVEYLWDVEEEIFSFLELNPRLQVEHPCSEMVTGVNIPVAQLLIAMGVPLNRIPDIRSLYEEVDIEGSSTIDFDHREQKAPMHHVIACRITAENPEDGWKPGGGRLEELTFRSSERVWGYFSIPGNGGMVHPYSDSQIGHIFARGPTREAARRAMVVALKETSIRAEFMTSTEYLVKLLEMDAFKENKHNTEFLDDIIRMSTTTTTQSPPDAAKTVKDCCCSDNDGDGGDLGNLGNGVAKGKATITNTNITAIATTNKTISKSETESNKLPMHFIICAGVCWRAMALLSRWTAENIEHLKRGQKPTGLERRLMTTFQYAGYIHNIEVKKRSEKSFILSYKDDGPSVLLDSLRLSDGGLLIQMESGETLVTYALGSPGSPKDGSEGGLWLKINGCSYVLEAGVQDPTELRSPSPGKLSRWTIPQEAYNSQKPLPKGTPVAEIEVMKMYMQLTLPHQATITIIKGEGENVEAGELLARLLPTDLDLLPSLKEWTLSFSTLPSITDSTTNTVSKTRTVDERWTEVKDCIVRGFYPAVPIDEQEIGDIFTSFLDPSYGVRKLKLLLTNVRLAPELDSKVSVYLEQGCLAEIHALLLKHAKTDCDSRDLAALNEILCQLEPLLGCSWLEGLLVDILEGWLEVALLFEDVPTSSIVLQRMHLEQRSPEEQLAIFSSYNESLRRSKMLSSAIGTIVPLLLKAKVSLTQRASRSLEQISRLQQSETGNVDVARKAREALMAIMGPGIVEMRAKIEDHLRGRPSSTEELDSISKGLLPWAMELLPLFLLHPEDAIRVKAMEQYVRRVFEAFRFVDLYLFTSSLVWTLEADGVGATAKPTTATNTKTRKTTPENNKNEKRSGIFVSILEPADDMSSVLDKMISTYLPELGKVINGDAALKNIAYIAMPSFDLESFLLSLKERGTCLCSFGLRRITVIIPSLKGSIFHTFRYSDWEDGLSTATGTGNGTSTPINTSTKAINTITTKRWDEDLSVRQMEPALAYLLELRRIYPCYPGGLKSIFNDPTGQIHIYRSPASERLWVRVLVRPRLGRRGKNRMSDLVKDGQEIFMETLDCLQYVVNMEDNRSATFSCNHLMINIIPPFHATPEMASEMCLSLMKLEEGRLLELGVMEGEIRLNLIGEDLEESPKRTAYRFLLWNETGFVHRLAAYEECVGIAAISGNGGNGIDIGNGNSDSTTTDTTTTNTDHENISNTSKEIILKSLFEMEGESMTKIIAARANDSIYKLLKPYPSLSDVQIKRNRAHSMGTSWVYDYPSILKEAIEGLWRGEGGNDVLNNSSDHVFRFQEIILNPSFIAKRSGESDKQWVKRLLRSGDASDGNLGVDDDGVDNDGTSNIDGTKTKTPSTILLSNREFGLNKIGMVAWKMWCRTPQRPNGYEFIIIANDIDTGRGAFGLEEDVLFGECSKLARHLRCPRIFISANSGARLGVCEEIKEHLRVRWKVEGEPDKGFEYLYLEDSLVRKRGYADCDADIKNKNSNKNNKNTPVKLERQENGDWKITDVIGGLGIGVENLSGSGMIAGETSKAYQEGDIMTLTLVTGRSVGIGAYLVRLGQRVIQRESQPIILTGYQALNNLLGRELYSSNLQLGGPQIMSLNGVSHRVVTSDLVAVKEALKWMDYLRPVPLCLPITEWPPFVSTAATSATTTTTTCSTDSSPTRAIDPSLIPKSDLDDPRLFLCGKYVVDGDGDGDGSLNTKNKTTTNVKRRWLPGLLDRSSFQEYQEDWAKSVIVGRGRLAGEPLAVLMTESRQTHHHIPADPASPESSSSTKVVQAGGVWFPDSSKKTAQFISDCNWGERLPLLIVANWRGFSGGQMDLFGEILKFGSNIVDSIRQYRQPITVYIPPNGQLRGGSWVVIDPTINPLWMKSFADPTARGGIIEPEGLVGVKFRQKQLQRLALQTMTLQQREAVVKASDDATGAGGSNNSINTLMHRVACHFADLHDKPSRMLHVGSIDAIVPTCSIREFLSNDLKKRLWGWRLLQRVLYLTKDLLVPGIQERFLSLDIPAAHEDAEALVLAFVATQRRDFFSSIRNE